MFHFHFQAWSYKLCTYVLNLHTDHTSVRILPRRNTSAKLWSQTVTWNVFNLPVNSDDLTNEVIHLWNPLSPVKCYSGQASLKFKPYTKIIESLIWFLVIWNLEPQWDKQFWELVALSDVSYVSLCFLFETGWSHLIPPKTDTVAQATSRHEVGSSPPQPHALLATVCFRKISQQERKKSCTYVQFNTKKTQAERERDREWYITLTNDS